MQNCIDMSCMRMCHRQVLKDCYLCIADVRCKVQLVLETLCMQHACWFDYLVVHEAAGHSPNGWTQCTLQLVVGKIKHTKTRQEPYALWYRPSQLVVVQIYLINCCQGGNEARDGTIQPGYNAKRFSRHQMEACSIRLCNQAQPSLKQDTTQKPTGEYLVVA